MAIDFLSNMFKIHDYEHYLEVGQEAIENKDFSLAIANLDKAIQKKHNSAKAYNLRGYAKRWLGKYEEAIKDYEIAINIDNNYADAYYNMGNAYGMLGRYQIAVDKFTKSISLNPNNAEALCFRGVAFRYMNKLDEALRDLNAAISLDKGLGVAYSQRGFVHKLKENLEEMFNDLSNAIKLGENDALTKFYIGYYYFIKENNNLAQKYIQESLKLNDKLPESYYYLGLIYDKNDKLDEAKKMMTICIELDANYHLAYYHRAVYNLYTNHKTAIDDFNKAIEIYPSNLLYYITLSQLYIKIKDFLEAVAILNKALFYFSDSYSIYFLLAQCFFYLNNFSKAKTCIEKSLTLSNQPDEGQYMLLIDILHEMKLYDEEIEQLNKTMLLFPNNFDFLYKKGVALNLNNNHKEAIYIFNKYEKVNGKDAYMFLHRAFAFFGLKNYNKACEDLIKSAELDFELIKRYKTNLREDLFRDLYYVYKFTQNIKNNLDIATNYYERGNIKLLYKCYSLAVEDYNLALQYEKEHYFALNNAANSYNKMGLYSKALEYINEAIKLRPFESKPYFNRGCIYIELNKYNEALDDLRIAIKENPNVSEINERFGYIYNKLNNNELALQYYNIAVQYSDSPYYVYKRGLFLQKLKIYNEALSDFSTVICKDNKFAEAYLKRAMVKYELGEKISALDDIKFAISLGNEEAVTIYQELSKQT